MRKRSDLQEPEDQRGRDAVRDVADQTTGTIIPQKRGEVRLQSVTVHDLDIQPIHVAPREVRGETIVLFHQDEA